MATPLIKMHLSLSCLGNAMASTSETRGGGPSLVIKDSQAYKVVEQGEGV